MYIGIFPKCVSVHHMCAGLMGARKECQNPCRQSYKLWVLGIKHGSSERRASALNL